MENVHCSNGQSVTVKSKRKSGSRTLFTIDCPGCGSEIIVQALSSDECLKCGSEFVSTTNTINTGVTWVTGRKK